jgi:hypothetical protein
MASRSANSKEALAMSYEPIVTIAKEDGSAELVGGWPLHTVIPRELMGTRHGVSVTPDPDDTNQLRIQVGDQTAVYEKVGVGIDGGVVCDWVPSGGE